MDTELNNGKPPPVEFIRYLLEHGQEKEARELEKRWKMQPMQIGCKPAPSTDTEKWLMKFITQDERLLKVKDHVRILAPIKCPVLIIGATGTGKELLARALHGSRTGAFVDINCAGMPENLIESELFGHTVGSFTGANKETKGLIAAAANGTLFLDEVGDLAYPLQAKLLRMLQEGVYRQVGGTINLPVSCRIVAATHWNLSECLSSCDVRPSGSPRFRDDLYARLSTFELHTLPLKARLDDIPLIISSLDPDGKFPQRVNWSATPLPFNVRSLQQLVLRHRVLGTSPFNVTD